MLGVLGAEGRPMRWLTRDGLARAFAVSLMIHLILWSGWQLGGRFGWWGGDSMPVWLREAMARVLSSPAVRPQAVEVSEAKEIPLTFIEVDPASAVKEAPKEAAYYSTHSTLAANPEPSDVSDKPRLEGSQTLVPKLVDTERSSAEPPQPAPAKVELAREETPLTAAPGERTGGLAPGDEDVGRPTPKADPLSRRNANPGEVARGEERPRTFAELRPEQRSQIRGRAMEQAGGVRRRGQIAIDAKESRFAEYDRALVAAIQQRWDVLLEERGVDYARRGRVVLEFRLNYDGRITDMTLLEETVGDYLALLCRKAVEDPAPYAPWPSDMRRSNRTDQREIRFTFYYN